MPTKFQRMFCTIHLKIKIVYIFVYMDRFLFININMWKETYQAINHCYIIKSEKWGAGENIINIYILCHFIVQLRKTCTLSF